MATKEEIMDKIAAVQDPELNVSVVDLGLIYDVIPRDDKSVHVVMTLTSIGCPYGPQLISEIEQTVEECDGVERASVELVWEPMWNPVEMATEKGKDLLGLW